MTYASTWTTTFDIPLVEKNIKIPSFKNAKAHKTKWKPQHIHIMLFNLGKEDFRCQARQDERVLHAET